MKKQPITVIFYSLSGLLAVWCAFSPRWETVAVCLISAAIGAVSATMKPVELDYNKAQIDELKATIEGIKGQLAAYGMGDNIH